MFISIRESLTPLQSPKMAQALFEALAAGVATIDNQTALAVQSLLESQNVAEATQQAAIEDDDVFQCGKCKKQFTSLPEFVTHKQAQCVIATRKLPQVKQNVNSTPALPSTGSGFTTSPVQQQQAQVMGQQQQVTYSAVPASPLTQTLGPGMVLSDDLMALTALDQATLHAATLQVATSIPNSPFLSQIAAAPISLRSSTGSTATTTTYSSGSAPLPASATSFTAAALPSSLSSGSLVLQPVTSYVQAQLSGPPVVVTSTVTPTGNDKISLALPVLKTSPTKAARKASQEQAQQQQQQQQHHLQLQSVPVQAGQQAPAGSIIAIVDIDSGVQKQRRNSKGVITPNGPPSLVGTAGVTTASLLEEANSKKKLTCQYCDKTFSKNFDLQQHIRSHTGEKPFQCIVCGRAFAQKSNVKKHMQTHKVWPSGSGDTLPKQPIVVTDNGEGQVQEVTIHVDKQSASGVQSGVEMNISGPQQDDHGKLNVVIDNSYLCQYCPEKFKTYFQLKSHMMIHKSEQVYKCILKSCLATFSELDSFLEHTKSHEDEMTYRCHMCSKHFPSLYELGVHQYTHSLYPNQGPKSGPRYYRCTKCNNKYSTPEALEHHLSTTTHSYPCTQCDKIFACERYLRRHLPTHGSVGEHQCTQCEKRFKTEHYLKMHVLIHTGEKPYQCEVCDSKFNRKDKLKRHLLIHDPVKKYKCPFRTHTGCTKEFNRPDKLKAHIISHSGIKPYKCRDCGKAFSRRPHLLEHERMHRDDYKFRCEKCNRGFFREKPLKDHRCRFEKDGEEEYRQPEMYWRRTRRKVGRPRKRMITVTEDMLRENLSRRNTTRGRRGRRARATNAARAQAVETIETEPNAEQQQEQEQESTDIVEQQITQALQSQEEAVELHHHDQQADTATEYQLVQEAVAGVTGDSDNVSVTPINVSIPSAFQTATIPVCTNGGEISKEICVQIHPFHGSFVQGQGLEDGTEVPTQVITIEPQAFGAETVNIDPSQIMTSHGPFEGQMEAFQAAVSDVSNLSTATFIATGPNMAAIVVNTPSGEILTTDASGAMVTGGTQTVSYVTQEQFESLQASAHEQGSSMFTTSDTLLQSSAEILRQDQC